MDGSRSGQWASNYWVWVAMVVLLGVGACNTSDDASFSDVDNQEPNNQTANNQTPNNQEPNNQTANNQTPNNQTPNNQDEASCEDGEISGEQTDVDCGGPNCDPCETGQMCESSSDCLSERCSGGLCVEDEACAGVECASDEACAGGECYAACDGSDDCVDDERCYYGACLPTDCDDVECLDDEVCYEGACYIVYECEADGDDCVDGEHCIDGYCIPYSCEDGLMSGEQTDVDCGGPNCDPCELGAMCEVNDDCQPSQTGEWGDCEFPEATCIEEGEETRDVTHFECGADGVCEEVNTTESRQCTRDTTDEVCADTEYGDWSECEPTDSSDGVCSPSSIRTRTVTEFVCGGGSCEAIESTEEESCDADTDGVECADTEFGDWSECGDFDSECDQDGTRSRTVTSYECAGTSCNPVEETETEDCTRDTTGDVCGAEQEIGDWSECGDFDSECDQDGTRERTVTTYACASGSCEASSDTESQNCSRNTSGDACGDEVVYGDWSSCSGFSGTCGESGERSRTVYTYSCSGGQCSESTETETESCTRSTDGDQCDSTDFGAWGSCSFSGTCDELGERDRTVTSYACSGGSCEGTTTTDTTSDGCDRSTDGDGCGSGTCDDWGSCDYGDTCAETGVQERTCYEQVCSNSSCIQESYTETQNCSRSTDGVQCDDDEYGDWSDCSYGNDCSQSGSRGREVTTFACASGSCESTGSFELDLDSCSRNTDGDTCGDTDWDPWSGCLTDGQSCTGTETRQGTELTCDGGSCVENSITDERSCTANSGSPCTCSGGSFGTCTSFGTCDCSGSGCSTDFDCGPGEICCESGCQPDDQFCVAPVPR